MPEKEAAKRVAGPESITSERLAGIEALFDGPVSEAQAPWTATPEGYVLDAHNDIVAEALVERGHDPAISQALAFLPDLIAEVRACWETETLRVDENERLLGLLREIKKQLAASRRREEPNLLRDNDILSETLGELAEENERLREPLGEAPESITDGPGPTRPEVEELLADAAQRGIDALDALDALHHSGDLRPLADPVLAERLRARLQSADYAVKLACCKARLVAETGGDLGPKKAVAQ